MKIYNLGSLNIDYVYHVPHFVKPGETISSDRLQIFPGGKGLNQSVALAKAGADVIHGGLIGQGGGFLKDVLQKAGVQTSYIKEVDMPNGHAMIQVDEHGQNSIILFNGANHHFHTDFIETVLENARKNDLLLLQNEINGLSEIIEIAHKKQMHIALNPSPFDQKILSLPCDWIDYWLCNEIEGSQLTGKTLPDEILAEFSRRYPDKTLLLTLGKEGCMLLHHHNRYSHPIFPCKAVDTTAAGDTFTGFFLGMLSRGKDIEEVLKIASAASAIAVSRAGAASSIPDYEEVMNFLRSYQQSGEDS